MRDLAHSAAAVVRGLKKGGVVAKVSLSSDQLHDGPRPDVVRIHTQRHGSDQMITSYLSMELVRRAQFDIFEYEGEAHARLYRESPHCQERWLGLDTLSKGDSA